MSKSREIVILSSNEAVAHFAVNKWVEVSFKSVEEKGRFTVALSGGRTPVDFYERLSRCEEQLPWDETHIFLADERFVPPDDKDSNYGLIREHLLDHISIPEDNVHPVPTGEQTPECSAEKYEEDLRRFFNISDEGIPDFDLIMLGIGEDGHTASLFPETPSVEESRRLAIPVTTDRVPHQRISLTLAVLNNSKNIIFLVSGEDKAKVMKEILEDRDSALPAALVRAEKGALFFVMDEDAASLVTRNANLIFKFSSN